MNTWETADPRSIIPDPDGDFMTSDFSYIGFETSKRVQDMPDDWNTDDLAVRKNYDEDYREQRESF